jgi:hypothetical protein
MKAEGTISWVLGFHNIFHSYYVYKAWKLIYEKRPTMQETVCILIHDIGYINLNYFTNKSNANHEKLGAKIAYKLFGKEAQDLILGHRIFGEKLEVADEYSHILLPMWVLKLQGLFEHKSAMSPKTWKSYCRYRWILRSKGIHLKGQFEVYKEKKC